MVLQIQQGLSSMKSKLKRIIKFFPLACLIAITCSIGIGYATWQFSGDKTQSQDVQSRITTTYSFSWTNQSALENDSTVMKEMVEALAYALNAPASTEGQAFTKAWDANKNSTSWDQDYIGTMTDNETAAAELKIPFDSIFETETATKYSDYTMFIKKITTSNQSSQCNGSTQSKTKHVGFDFYLYKGKITSSSTSVTLSNIYKTCIEVIALSDTVNYYAPLATYKGSATCTTYRSGAGNNSIDSGTFKIDSDWGDSTSSN